MPNSYNLCLPPSLIQWSTPRLCISFRRWGWGFEILLVAKWYETRIRNGCMGQWPDDFILATYLVLMTPQSANQYAKLDMSLIHSM